MSILKELGGRPPHKTMTPDEYLVNPPKGWHEVCWNVDDFDNVGVRYRETDGSVVPVYDEPGWMEDGPDALDDGIIGVVKVLMAAGVKTFSSCQGGGRAAGHAHERPQVWFDGDDAEGERAEKIATDAGYQVFEVARFWYTRAGERTGPFWRLEFVSGAACRAPVDRG